MEFIVLMVVAGVVMAIILAGAYLTCQRVQDYCALEEKRAALIARVLNSRLGKMLRRLDISLRDYLGKFSEKAISHQVDTCQNCDASTACDDFLADSASDNTGARDFCPNMTDFDRLRSKPR